ncbi:MAG: fibronectin type III domain-containing protein [Gemmatimonadota bacterium]|nr:fibronectin type III domain-containing protein [Gemmatimonadota bacterium]
MIPIHLRLLRLIPAAAAAFSVLFIPGSAGARQGLTVFSDAGESAPRVRLPSDPVGAVAPTVDRWELDKTRDDYEEFDVIITWSEDVEGFRLSDIDVDDGTAIDLTGSGDRYTLTIEPDEIEGYVTITIRAGGVEDEDGEENAEEEERFEIDNRRPEFEDATVDGDELVMVYHEDLDEGSASTPSPGDFTVEVEGDDVDVDDVEVDRDEVILTLESPVEPDDDVRLSYDHGIGLLQDEAGNLADELRRERVDNITDQNAGTPGPPRDLTASADGASVIELDWREPTNPGDDDITGYRVEYSTDAGDTWQTLEDDTDDTGTSYRDTGLSPGTTRHYRVAAINRHGRGAWSNVEDATTGQLPGRPTGLTATARGTSRVELRWTAPSSVGSGPVTGYRIEASPNGRSRWSLVDANVGRRATSYIDTGLDPGTIRYYRIAATNSEGRGSWSNVADATTDASVPDAPTSLTVVPSGVGGRSELLLNWTRPSSDGGSQITGYRIEVSPNGVSGWTEREANTRSSATSYTHRGLSPSTTRHYRVAAINDEGRGPFSNVASGTTNTGTPTAPLSLRATADGPTSITLTWNVPSSDNGSRITGYRIRMRRGGTGAWTIIINDTGSLATTFQHTDLQPVTAYRYQVAAINAEGVGPWSLEASMRTHADVPSAPPTVTARAVSTSQINLSWAVPRNTGGAPILGYRVEASRDGGESWRIITANTGSTGRAYIHRNLRPGATWSYRVSAINSAGIGAPSGVARATTHAVPPGAPTGLRATPGGFGGREQIVLTWSAPSSDGGSPVTGYRVEVSTRRSGPWTILARNTGTTGTTYTHTGLAPGTTRYYRVAAINPRGTGAYSSVATGATNAGPPSAPRGLRANADGPTSITIGWEVPSEDNGAAITGYRIRARRLSESNWTTIRDNTGSTLTTFRHTDLQPVTTYRYQVAAINAEGAGPWSAEAGARTPADVPAPPTNLSARAMGTSQIDLSWRAPANTGGAAILGYRVEVSSDGGANWRILTRHTQSASTAYSHRNLEPATTRHYRVSAINLAGVGRASNVARGTTEAAVPGAPRTLTAQADGTSDIDLSWRAPSTDGGARITGYRIEVSDDGSATWSTLVPDTRSGGTNYSHTGLSPASTRHYRVSAINRIGAGRASNVASATTDATVPGAPTGLTAIATSPTQIDLTWAAPAYDGGARITGYRIEVSETGTAWTRLAGNTGSTGTSYSHTGLQPGSRRFYRVSAINRAGTGEPSNVASAATDDPVQRAGRLNTKVLPHVAAAMTSSTVRAIAGRIDAVASGMGMQRRMDMGGLSSMAASLSSPTATGRGPGRRGRSGAALLFGGTSFQMPLGVAGAPQQAGRAGQLATWGAGEYHHLGEPGSGVLDWSGSMVSAHVGADMRIATDILTGVAASYNTGTFDFTDKTGAAPVEGTYGTAMTSVNPYVAWFPGERGNAAWGTAGFGWGDIEVEDEREDLRTSPARMMTGAAGGSYQLMESAIGGVRVKAEGWLGRVMVDGGERIDSVTLDMQRARLALEWTQGYRSTGGNEVAIVLEGGMRYDNGDGVNGTGAEVGGGLRYRHAGVGLTAEGRGRLLISARDGYEEWGFGGMIQLDPATRGQGLQFRVVPAYGDAASGVNALWERGVSDAVRTLDVRGRSNVDAEVAYGLRGFRGTPYGGFRMAGGGARAFSGGVRYDLGPGMGLRIEGTRRAGPLGAAAHTVGVRGRLTFR